jgi:two-component sensor histidine kinase
MKKNKILLIEQDYLVIQDIRSYFENFDFEVNQLPDIAHSLPYLENNRSDVIIVDFGIIENADIISFSELVAKRFGIHVIYIINHPDKVKFILPDFGHPISYITKPYLMEELHDLVKKEIYYGKLQQELASKEREIFTLKEQFKLFEYIDKNESYLYQDVVNAIPMPIFLIHEDKVVFMNNFALSLTGISDNKELLKINNREILSVISESENEILVKVKNINSIYTQEKAYLSDLIINTNHFKQITIFSQNRNNNDFRKEIDRIINKKSYYFRQNLQLFSSLLNIESRSLINKDEDFSRLFMSNFNRFKVIFMLYNVIPDEEKISSLKIKDYLTKIINSLYYVYHKSYDSVRLNLVLTDFNLDYSNILTYGLIVNEIVSILLKYAFKDNESGDIKIKIEYLYDKNKLEITIDNNGLSLENIFKLNSDTLFSLSIINELSGQLNSSFYVTHNDKNNISKLIPN